MSQTGDEIQTLDEGEQKALKTVEDLGFVGCLLLYSCRLNLFLDVTCAHQCNGYNSLCFWSSNMVRGTGFDTDKN